MAVCRPPTAQPSLFLTDCGSLTLRVRGSAHDGRLIRIRSAKCTVGSAPGCTLRLRADGVEPLHCWVLRGRSGAVIRRLHGAATLNGGTFDDSPLCSGDRLRLGAVELEVVECCELAPALAPQPFPPPIIPATNTAELEAKLDEVTEQVTRLEGEARQGWQASIVAAERANQLRDALAAADQQLADAGQELAAVQETMTRQTAELESLRRQLAGAHATEKTLTEKLRQQQAEHEAALEALRRDGATATGAMTIPIDQLNSGAAADLEKWRSRCTELEGQIETLQKELASGMQTLHEAQNERKAAAQARREAEQQTATLEQQLAEQLHEVQAMRQKAVEHAALQSRAEELTGQIARQARALAEAKEQADAALALMCSQEEQAERDRERARRNEEVTAREDELARARLDLDQARKELEDARQRLESERGQVGVDHEQAEIQRRQLAAELDALNSQRQGLESADQQLAAERERLVAANQQLAGERERLQAADQQLAAERERLVAADQQLAAERGRLQSADQQLAGERERLQAADQQLTTERERLEAERRQLEAEKAAPQDQLREYLDQHSAELESRRQALDEKVAEFEQRRLEFEKQAGEWEARRNEELARLADRQERASSAVDSVASQPVANDDGDREAVHPANVTAPWQPPEELAAEEAPCSEIDPRQLGMTAAFAPPEENVTGSNSVDSALDRLVRSGVWRKPSEPDKNDPPAAEPPSMEAPTPAAAIEEAPVHPAPAPVAPEASPTPSPQPAEEDSIESYMDRLLKRVRGESTTNAGGWKQNSSAEPTPAPDALVTAAPEPIAEQPAEAPEKVKEEEQYVPRTKAPEMTADLSAMREVANSAAQHAIDRHSRKHQGKLAAGRLFGACLTATASILLAYWAWKGQSLQAGIGAALGGALGMYWILGAALRILNVLRLNPPEPASNESESAAK